MAITKKHSELTGSSLHNPKGITVKNTPEPSASVLTLDLERKSILPTGDSNVVDIGSTDYSFRDIHIEGNIYQDGTLFSGTGGSGSGIFAGPASSAGDIFHDYTASNEGNDIDIFVQGTISASRFHGAYMDQFTTASFSDHITVGNTVTASAYWISGSGYILSATGAGLENVTASLFMSGTGDNIYREFGNVGFGTNTPLKKLHVLGESLFQGDMFIPKAYSIKRSEDGAELLRIGDTATKVSKGVSIGLRGATPNMGIQNVLIGDTTAQNIGTNAKNNVLIGYLSGDGLTGTVQNNTILGSEVWTNGENGNRNVFIGYNVASGSSSEVGGWSDKLIIHNSATTKALIQGEMKQDGTSQLGINIDRGLFDNSDYDDYRFVVSGSQFTEGSHIYNQYGKVAIGYDADESFGTYNRLQVRGGRIKIDGRGGSDTNSLANSGISFVNPENGVEGSIIEADYHGNNKVGLDFKTGFNTGVTKAMIIDPYNRIYMGHNIDGAVISSSMVSDPRVDQAGLDITASAVYLSVSGSISASNYITASAMAVDTHYRFKREEGDGYIRHENSDGNINIQPGSSGQVTLQVQGNEQVIIGESVTPVASSPLMIDGATYGTTNLYVSGAISASEVSVPSKVSGLPTPLVRSEQTSSFITSTGSNEFFGDSQHFSPKTSESVEFVISGSIDLIGSNIAYKKNGAEFFIVDERGTVFGEHSALGLGTFTSGSENTLIGYNAGDDLRAFDRHNVMIGDLAGGQMFGSASHNVVIGKSAGYNVGSGSHNILIGSYAGAADLVGYKTHISGCIFIGHQAGRVDEDDSIDDNKPFGSIGIGAYTQVQATSSMLVVVGFPSSSVTDPNSSAYEFTKLTQDDSIVYVKSGSITHNDPTKLKFGINTLTPNVQGLTVSGSISGSGNLTLSGSGGKSVVIDPMIPEINGGSNTANSLLHINLTNSESRDTSINNFVMVSGSTRRVGIGTTLPTGLLTLFSGSYTRALDIISETNQNKDISFVTSDGLGASTVQGRIRYHDDNSGATADRLEFGTNIGTDGSTLYLRNKMIGINQDNPEGLLHIKDNDNLDIYFDAYHGTDDKEARLHFRKGAGTAASPANVADGESLGLIDFAGYHTNGFDIGAGIHAEVDGTPGDSDMPGRLLFKVTKDGDPSPTERMRITKDGRIITTTLDSINLSTPSSSFQVIGTDSIIIPSGSTGQRGTAAAGAIRFNTDTNEFEGYDKEHWGSLGGVKDSDGDTFIVAHEHTAGASEEDNDQLQFFTANDGATSPTGLSGSMRMVISSGSSTNIMISDESASFHLKGRSIATPLNPVSAGEGTTTSMLHLSGGMVRVESGSMEDGTQDNFTLIKGGNDYDAVSFWANGKEGAGIGYSADNTPHGLRLGTRANSGSVNVFIGSGAPHADDGYDKKFSIWDYRIDQGDSAVRDTQLFEVSSSGAVVIRGLSSSLALGVDKETGQPITGSAATNLNKTLSVKGDSYFDGAVDITGIVTALELHTTFDSASILYSSGSSKIGDTYDDVHAFTGSLRMAFVSESVDVHMLDAQPIHYFIGDLNHTEATGGYQDVSIGIGTSNPGNYVGGQVNLYTTPQFTRPIFELSGSNPALVINAGSGVGTAKSSGSLWWGHSDATANNRIFNQEFENGRLTFNKVNDDTATTKLLTISSSGQVGIGNLAVDSGWAESGSLVVGGNISFDSYAPDRKLIWPAGNGSLTHNYIDYGEWKSSRASGKTISNTAAGGYVKIESTLGTNGLVVTGSRVGVGLTPAQLTAIESDPASSTSTFDWGLWTAGDLSSSATMSSEFAYVSKSIQIGGDRSSHVAHLGLRIIGQPGNSGQIYVNDVDDGVGVTDGFLINKSGNTAYAYNRDAGDFHLGTNDDTQKIVIKQDGDIGIGNNTPSKKLEVTGDISASGNVFLRDGARIFDDASSIAIGAHSTTGGEAQTSSIAIGSGSQAHGVGSGQRAKIAIGVGAQSFGQYGISLGYLANSTGSDGIAIGRSAQIGMDSGQHNDSIAIGREAKVSASAGIAIGLGAEVGTSPDGEVPNQLAGYNSIAIGNGAQASSSYGVAIGFNAKTLGMSEEIAIGRDVSAAGTGSMAIGTQALVTASSAGLINIHPSQAASLEQDNTFAIMNGTTTLKTGIGTLTPTKTLTVYGDISASGDIWLENGAHYIQHSNDTDTKFGFQNNDVFEVVVQSNQAFIAKPNELLFGNGGQDWRFNSSAGNRKMTINQSTYGTQELTLSGSLSASGKLFLDTGQQISFETNPTSSVGDAGQSHGVTNSFIGCGTNHGRLTITQKWDLDAPMKHILMGEKLYLTEDLNPSDHPTLETLKIGGAGGVSISASNSIVTEGELSVIAQSGSGNSPGLQLSLMSGSHAALPYDMNWQVSALKTTGDFYIDEEFRPGFNPRFIIQSGSGNTGIGKQQPTKKLEVAGDISASGDLYLSERTDTIGDIFKDKKVDSLSSNGADRVGTLDSFPTASFTTVKYLIQVTSASGDFYSSEILAGHNHTSSYYTEYAQIGTMTSELGKLTFRTKMNNYNMELEATSSTTTNYGYEIRVDRTIIRNTKELS